MQLAKQHTLILICRPFLPLSGLVATPTLDTNDESMKTTQLQDRCLDAALHTCRLVMPLSRKEHIGGNFWVSETIRKGVDHCWSNGFHDHDFERVLITEMKLILVQAQAPIELS